MDGLLRYVVIAALAAVMLASGTPPGYLSGDGSWLLRASTYSLFHASWWHLAVNAIAVWTLLPRRGRWKRYLSELAVAYLIAVLVFPVALRPVVGFSNVLYAVIGLRTPALSSPWWRKPQVIVFLAVTAALVVVPSFSATTHIAAFVLGALGAALKRSIDKVTSDVRRLVR